MKTQNELSYWLYLSRVRGVGVVKFNQIILKNKKLKITLSEFFKLPEKDIASHYSFLPRQSLDEIILWKNKLDEERLTLERLEKMSVKVLTIEDNDYPESLKESLGLSAPPILYSKGNISLLKRRGFAVVGSRNPSQTGRILTKTITEELIRLKYCVVSGYARGTDLVAHNSALKENGKTIMILGYGIYHFSSKWIFQDYENYDNMLAVSEFYPSYPWHKGFLLTRNTSVCGLAKGVFVVESKGGGSYHTGTYSLMLKKPTLTLDYMKANEYNSGNIKLIDQGAIPLACPEGDEEISFRERLKVLLEEVKSLYSLRDNGRDNGGLFDELGESLKNYVKKNAFFPIYNIERGIVEMRDYESNTNYHSQPGLWG